MNEKTKKILSYIACALGGMALGVALLGGLAMCSTSTEAEAVNTLTKTKKNAVSTTDGGYTSYTFSIPLTLDNTENNVYYTWYEFDYSTASLGDSVLSVSETLESSTIILVSDYVETAKTAYSMNDNEVYLLVVEGYSFLSSTWGVVQWSYISFMSGSLSSANVSQFSFVKTSSNYLYAYKVSDSFNYAFRNVSQTNLLTYNEVNYIGFNPTLSTLASVTYQDVTSYYQELGYQDGYEDGETTGYNSGYEVGYSDGSETGRMFTQIGLTQTTWYLSDLTANATTDTSNTYYLLDFKDGENQTWRVSATYYFGSADEFIVSLYKGESMTSSTLYANMAETTMVYTSGAWQAEISTGAYFTFDFAQVTEVYNNSLPNNYFLLTGTPDNATGYQQGYIVGYQEGYLASPGGQATTNVFSLFTNAFDSVAGIFTIKVFGFLPLYWFFLTPIFIAIITLLIRMVKH